MSHTLKDIFNTHYSSLCNYAAVLLKDKHAAEDVVQTVFIQLWENDKLLQLKNPEPYLLQCVKFKCIDYLRSNTLKKEVFNNDLPEIGIEVDHSLKEEDIDSLLSFFVAQLPPKMRQVFLLSRKNKLTYKEIAESLDVSVKTIENQMGQALKKLRILLKEHHYLPTLMTLLTAF